MLEGYSRSEKPIDKAMTGIFENNIGTFSLMEDDDGQVDVWIETKDGQVIDLSDFLPPGYEFIGNVRVYKEDRFAGFGNSDSSFCLQEDKAIILSETEMKKKGWEYALMVLHEIGHAVFAHKNPDFRDEMHSFVHYKRGEGGFQQTAFLKSEEMYAKDERLAWKYAFETFVALAKKYKFDEREIFPNEGDKKKMADKSLAMKIPGVLASLKSYDVKGKQRQKIMEKVKEMYDYKLNK